MFHRFIYYITVKLLYFLEVRGFNLGEIFMSNDVNRLNDHLIAKQSEISIKRVEIVVLQNKLLTIIEPPLFTLLAKSNDSMEKTIITKVWIDSLQGLQKMVDEHEALVTEFTNSYSQLTQANNI